MKKGPSQHSKFYEELGTNIRKYRNQRNLSQDALAKLVSLTRTSLTNIEKGRQHPPVHTLCEIGDQLKVDISQLLPCPKTIEEPLNLRALAGRQLPENELAFIETAIKGGTPYGDTKKQNSGDGRQASRG